MRRIPLPTLFTAGVVVLVLLIYMFTFTVRFSEVAVKVRWGKVVAIVTQPGFNWRWPWPIERIQKYDTRLRTLDTMEGEIKTKDGKNIIVGNYALWRIKDPQKFYIAVGTPPQAEEKLRAWINQRRAAVIGNENLSAFVDLHGALVNENYDRIEAAMLTGRQMETQQAEGPHDERSLYELALQEIGVELVKVDLRRISLPQETTESVFQQMIAERQKEAARFREEGKSRAETITAQADAARKQILAFANRKATEIRATGMQASTSILKQIEAQDAGFFEWLRKLDALRVALRERSTIFLDSHWPLFNQFRPPTASQPALDAGGG